MRTCGSTVRCFTMYWLIQLFHVSIVCSFLSDVTSYLPLVEVAVQ